MKHFNSHRKISKNQEKSEDPKLDEREKGKIDRILSGDFTELNSFASNVANELAKKGLSTSQIRNVFDRIQTMRKFDLKTVALLRAQLAYAVGKADRKKRYGIKKFQLILDYALQNAKEDNFGNVKNLTEALVAYHRYHGGKE